MQDHDVTTHKSVVSFGPEPDEFSGELSSSNDGIHAIWRWGLTVVALLYAAIALLFAVGSMGVAL